MDRDCDSIVDRDRPHRHEILACHEISKPLFHRNIAKGTSVHIHVLDIVRCIGRLNALNHELSVDVIL